MDEKKIKRKVIRKDGKRALATRLSNELLDELDEVCKEYGFTKSGFIERAVRQMLKNIKDDSRLF